MAPTQTGAYTAAMLFLPILARTVQVSLLTLCVLSPGWSQRRAQLDPTAEAPLPVDRTAALLGLENALSTFREPVAPARDLQLAAQQEVIATVTEASLEVDATTGQIDQEIAETHELQNFLVARRQREIDLLNLVSFGIGGSLGTASAALGLTPHVKASGVVGIVSGTSITALSALGLHLRPGGKAVLEAHANMLCNLFDLPSDPNNFYPPRVATFMAQPAPAETVSRKQHLIATWVTLGRIPAPETEKGRLKIARLASVPQQNTHLSLGDLDDRQAMLYDMRARVMYMKRDLALLMAAVAKPLR